MINVKKVLFATDFSPYSTQAYFHAVALAASHRASLTILFIYSPGFGSTESGEPKKDRQYWRNQLEQIRPVDSDIPVQHVFLEGDPATEMVRYAAESGADLIVMGTHGRSGLERLLMGSVAEKVMREALCSVLVVKMPKAIPVVDTPRATVAFSPA